MSAKHSSQKKTFVNLACGATFVDAPNWINFDFAATGPAVHEIDLLERLPLNDRDVDFVYCSHFLEHIPRNRTVQFLQECHRVLKPGGILRLVVPDFEEMCMEYLKQRQSQRHEQADYMMIEILDQCVRKTPGGELGLLYRDLAAVPDSTLHAYIRQRAGEDIAADSPNLHSKPSGWMRRRDPRGLLRNLQSRYTRFVCLLLPAAFRRQNVSFAPVGENHAWLYDYHSLQAMLVNGAGFTKAVKLSCVQSGCDEFPFRPLDATEDGKPRKGLQSMFVEATKQ